MDKNEIAKKSILDEWDTIKKMKENESPANKNKPSPFNISDDRHYAIGQFIHKNLLKNKKLLKNKFTKWISDIEHMGKTYDFSEEQRNKLYTLYNDLEGLMNDPFLTKSEFQNNLEKFSAMFKRIYTPKQNSTSQAGGSISRKTKKSKKRRGTKKRK